MSLIRDERRRNGMTQVELCARARVAPATLRHAERWGPHTINEDSRRRILSALGPDSVERIACALGLARDEVKP